MPRSMPARPTVYLVVRARLAEASKAVMGRMLVYAVLEDETVSRRVVHWLGLGLW